MVKLTRAKATLIVTQKPLLYRDNCMSSVCPILSNFFCQKLQDTELSIIYTLSIWPWTQGHRKPSEDWEHHVALSEPVRPPSSNPVHCGLNISHATRSHPPCSQESVLTETGLKCGLGPILMD